MVIYNPDAPRRLPLSRREKLIRAVGAIVLLGTTAWLLANWGSLPVRLPSHYGFGGEIDGWSGRGSLGPVSYTHLSRTDSTGPMKASPSPAAAAVWFAEILARTPSVRPSAASRVT